VWEEEIFKKIGTLYGDFLDFDEDTISKKRLDVTRLKVCTQRRGVIDDQIDISVVGAVFVLTVVEDFGEVVVSREVESREWEVNSSGGPGGEELVGTELGVHSDEDGVSPKQVLVGKKVRSLRFMVTKERMGQEEGQNETFCQV